MLTYNDLYELLRKEKCNETLQQLPQTFIEEAAVFLAEQRAQSTESENPFAEHVLKSKKQFENSISLFKELMLRRKKKLLNLVFVATETGIMKRDYEYMLPLERHTFDKFVTLFEEHEQSLSARLHGAKAKEQAQQMFVIFNQSTDQFVALDGSMTGPFAAGEVAHLDAGVAAILVSSGKAKYVDEP